MSLMCHALPIQVSADSHINILWCPNTWKKTAEMFVGEGGAFSVSVKERAPYTSTLAFIYLQTLVALCHHLPSFSRQRGKNSNQRDRCSFLLLGGSGW